MFVEDRPDNADLRNSQEGHPVEKAVISKDDFTKAVAGEDGGKD